jgi:uncharacterized protein YicC (UPF0701 family)
MLLSMTGFANKTIELTTPAGARASVSLNLRSLNARFFEVTCKLPYALQALDYHAEHSHE